MLGLSHNQNTYYDILKVRPGCTDSQVRDAYVTLAKIYHPDHNPKKRHHAQSRFRLINEAYATLKTQDGRTRYDALLEQKLGTPKGLNIYPDNDNASEKGMIRGAWHNFLNMLNPSSPSKAVGRSKYADLPLRKD